MQTKQKRGQVTMFVVFGIALLVLMILFLFLREQIFTGPVSINLDDQLVPLENHIKTCLKTIGEPLLHKIGTQGGYLKLSEDSYARHNQTPISYLCYNRESDAKCNNRMLTKKNMEEEVSQAIEQALPNCLNFNKFKKGMSITTNNQQVTTTIGEDATILTLHLPITLKKQTLSIQRTNFTQTLTYPLGSLYQVSQDIVNEESETGNFDHLAYILAYRGKYSITKQQPYPHKLYMIKKRNNPYLFQFMIQ